MKAPVFNVCPETSTVVATTVHMLANISPASAAMYQDGHHSGHNNNFTCPHCGSTVGDRQYCKNWHDGADAAFADFRAGHPNPYKNHQQ